VERSVNAHAFITDREGETLLLEADHRRHAEVENAIRDLKEGVSLNHLPSGRFAANGAWLAIAMMAHNLARWTARIGLGSGIVTTRTLRGDGASPDQMDALVLAPTDLAIKDEPGLLGLYAARWSSRQGAADGDRGSRPTTSNRARTRSGGARDGEQPAEQPAAPSGFVYANPGPPSDESSAEGGG
jgi:hypothetical protein